MSRLGLKPSVGSITFLGFLFVCSVFFPCYQASDVWSPLIRLEFYLSIDSILAKRSEYIRTSLSILVILSSSRVCCTNFMPCVFLFPVQFSVINLFLQR